MELTGQFYFDGTMKETKRRQIMMAAEALFRRGRFDEVTMDDVARKSGVGKGTLYRYFKDKEDLFFEVAVSGFEELAEMVRTERERSADFNACLLGVVRRISDFYRHRHQLMHTMPAGARGRRGRGRFRRLYRERREVLLDAIASMLAAGGEEGVIRGDMTPGVLAEFLLSVLRMRGRLTLDDAAVVGLFMDGAGGGERSVT